MNKHLPAGQAYACPRCGGLLQPHDGPWDVLHCIPCNRSVDLWTDPVPAIVATSAAVLPYRPELLVSDRGMAPEKVREAFAQCRALVADATPLRHSSDWREHVAFMCEEGATYVDGRREKAMRWLGFVQGTLWAFGCSDVDTLKNMNRPDAAPAEDCARRDVPSEPPAPPVKRAIDFITLPVNLTIDFVTARANAMIERPGMWGGEVAVESQLMLLLEVEVLARTGRLSGTTPVTSTWVRAVRDVRGVANAGSLATTHTGQSFSQAVRAVFDAARQHLRSA